MDLRAWIHAEHRELRDLFERAILKRIPHEQLTARVGRTGNSIAWLMWHLARAEDVAINSVIRGVPQVLTVGGWPERLGVADERIGTGFQDDEVEELSRSINVEALNTYWQAVCRATDDWLERVPIDSLDIVPDLDARLGSIPDIVGKAGSGLLDFWRGRPVGWFLRFPVINHGYIHLGQMVEIRGRLGIKGP